MDNDLKHRMISIQNNLPSRQQMLCKYIINNIHDVSMMTVKSLSENSGVGTTTILRFIDHLGYEKYPDFKNALIRYNVRNHQDTWWHLKQSLETEENSGNSLISTGKNTISDIENMLLYPNSNHYEIFLDILSASRKLYFLGLRTSKSLAIYAELMLRGILDHVEQLSFDPDFLYDQSLKFKQEDAIVVFAISPYTRQTIDYIKYISQHTEIDILLITDLETCPLINISTAHLITTQSNSKYSIVPAVTIIESLIIDLGKKKPDSVEKISGINEIHAKNDITLSQ